MRSLTEWIRARQIPIAPFDEAAKSVLREAIVSSVFARARNWHALLSLQTLPLLAETTIEGILPGIGGEALGHAAELAGDKGLDLVEEHQEEREAAATAGDAAFHGASDTRMKLGEAVYLALTPTKLGIFHLKGIVEVNAATEFGLVHVGGSYHPGLGRPALLIPRSAIAGSDLTSGHYIYFPLTLDLAVRLTDRTTLRFGEAPVFAAEIQRFHAAIDAPPASPNAPPD